VLADGLALAVGVGGEVDGLGLLGGLLQLGDDLLVVALLRVRNQLVGRLEVVLHVHAEALRREVFDVAERGHHAIIWAEVFTNRLRLRRRLYHH
jgi:hypothetical protein